jgi:hypothetical protein
VIAKPIFDLGIRAVWAKQIHDLGSPDVAPLLELRRAAGRFLTELNAVGKMVSTPPAVETVSDVID